MATLNLEDNEVAFLQRVLETKCLIGEALGLYLKISQQAAMQRPPGNGLAAPLREPAEMRTE